MPKKPSVQKTQKLKKPSKSVLKNTDNASVSELIKSNNFLNKYCDFINSENQRNAMRIMELTTYFTLMERTMRENAKMLDFVMSHLSPRALDKIKKEIDESGIQFQKMVPKRNGETPIQNVSQTFTMHDDITVKCPNCKSISTTHEKSCKECGYKI